MAKTTFSARRSGTNTSILSPQTMKEENIYPTMKRQQPKKNPNASNTVSFVGDREEESEAMTPIQISSIPISYSNKMRSSSFSSAKVKIKPLLKKKSLDPPLMGMSNPMAGDEGLGIFMHPPRASHTRSSSGVSSILTTGSVHNQTAVQYRQVPTSMTMSRSRSRADSHEDSPSPYAPVPKTSRTPPPLHIRTLSNGSVPRIMSSSQTHLDYPASASSIRGETFSPESMGRSGRSSFDSVFRRRARSNVEEDPIAAAALVREEWFARQAAKQRKRNEEEARVIERAERRQDRMSEVARRKGQPVEGRRSRANTINTVASSEMESTLGAVKYVNTRPGLPVDRELEWIRAGKRPPATRQTTSSTMRKKARGTKNAFEKFFYDLYTGWLKLLNLVGLKRAA